MNFYDKIINTLIVLMFYCFYENYMNWLVFSYTGSSRELKRVIISLLKSGYATNVHKLNYVQSFWLKDNNVEKLEIKYIIVYTDDEEKLLNFLSKSFPEIKRVVLK